MSANETKSPMTKQFSQSFTSYSQISNYNCLILISILFINDLLIKIYLI